MSDLKIGKSGITDNFVEELKTQIKKHDTVKVKFLGSAVANKQEFLNMAEELAERSGTKIIKKIGHTATYQKTFKN
jgi:RNA-binding protein